MQKGDFVLNYLSPDIIKNVRPFACFIRSPIWFIKKKITVISAYVLEKIDWGLTIKYVTYKRAIPLYSLVVPLKTRE